MFSVPKLQIRHTHVSSCPTGTTFAASTLMSATQKIYVSRIVFTSGWVVVLTARIPYQHDHVVTGATSFDLSRPQNSMFVHHARRKPAYAVSVSIARVSLLTSYLPCPPQLHATPIVFAPSVVYFRQYDVVMSCMPVPAVHRFGPHCTMTYRYRAEAESRLSTPLDAVE